ncbi:MAG TPA: FtsX-like permease family protein [Longimicrobiaceae bacterium]|nr:FtsX-like permease family protein [Longimicrobiaceae bacterium]
MTTRQLLSLAWRESRFARRKLFLFLSAISLGVAAMVAVQGFAANLQREVSNQARAMLGADVSLSRNQPFGEGTAEVLDSVAAAGIDIARVTAFASMALHPGTGATRLVQIRAPEPGFPFYGVIETAPAGQWETLHDGRNAVVDPALLVALGAEVGDSIAIGATRFRITGALERLPGDVEVASSFAPRVFLPRASLEETELLGFGARVDYEAFLRIPDPAVADAFVEGHRPLWRAERVRARTLEDQQERMQEALGRLSDFLGLIGVFALLLGGIGVASAMAAYMARKADTVAVLRCLGATARQVFGIYLLQAAAMGLAGAAVGVTLGAAVQWTLPRMLEGLLPVDVRIRPDGVAIVTGIVVGVWTAVAFALLPLLQVRRVSPLSALRRRVEPVRLPGRDHLRLAAWGALVTSVLLLVIYQAGELEVGIWVAAGIGGTLIVLWLSAHGLTRLLRRLPRTAFAYPLRQGLANLHRPGNQTATVVLALGFGAFLIATLILTQANILRPLEVDTTTRGNLLFFDVQEEQVEGVRALLAERGLPIVQSVPIVPMRVAAINGVPVPRFDDIEFQEELAEAEREGDGARTQGGPSRWALRREYRSTFRDTINTSEVLAAGEWWDARRPDAREPYELSLEQDVAGDLAVGLGDRIDWEVQGVMVPTVVTSLRGVDWARFEPNFFAVFESAALRGAPQTWVLLARADSAADRALVQRDIITEYPNVSAIDLTLVQRALDDVIGRVSLVIRFLAGFSVATGFIVLLGAIATGRLQRIRESVLLKTIGATRRQIGAILLTEYAALGLLSVVAGAGLALAAGWGLARWLFNVDFGVEPGPLLLLAAAIAALTALIGLSASRDVFRSTPMEAIREE